MSRSLPRPSQKSPRSSSMVRTETVSQNKFRAILKASEGWESDRIEPTAGSTPGFPDTVFWISGRALPVEFKVGRLIGPSTRHMVKVDYRPAQRLWWRKAALQNRTALVAVCTGPRVGLFRASEALALEITGVAFDTLFVREDVQLIRFMADEASGRH